MHKDALYNWELHRPISDSIYMFFQDGGTFSDFNTCQNYKITVLGTTISLLCIVHDLCYKDNNYNNNFDHIIKLVTIQEIVFCGSSNQIHEL